MAGLRVVVMGELTRGAPTVYTQDDDLEGAGGGYADSSSDEEAADDVAPALMTSAAQSTELTYKVVTETDLLRF
jgi:hypothetical protein